MADGLIPEPLRHFMEVYLHPEVAGEDWEECVDSYQKAARRSHSHQLHHTNSMSL